MGREPGWVPADERACVPDPAQEVEAQLALLGGDASAAVSPADLPGIAVEHRALASEVESATGGRLRVARELLVEVNQPGRPHGPETSPTGEGAR